VLAFDDSFVHAVENTGPVARTVLLVNVWKPVFCELHGCHSP
jgi:aspartyl/asparaginyl beta-hydroxylase (cupin superfamily)